MGYLCLDNPCPLRSPKVGWSFDFRKRLCRITGAHFWCCLKTLVNEQGIKATSLQILVCSYVLNHRCHHEFDALPKNVFSPYYLSTAGVKSRCLGNKCWSNTQKSHILFAEMQLGGLSRATFSKQLQVHLAWFWISSKTIWNSLICSPAYDFWAGAWQRESWEAAALFPCLSLPSSASRSAPQMLGCWSPIGGSAKTQLRVWRQLAQHPLGGGEVAEPSRCKVSTQQLLISQLCSPLPRFEGEPLKANPNLKQRARLP